MTRTFMVIGVVVALLLAAMQEFWLIAVIASIAFLSYVLRVTPPEKVKHEITTHGVRFATEFFGWNELEKYYFGVDGSDDILVVDTKEVLPGRLFFIINSADKDKISELFSKHVHFMEKPPEGFMEKTYSSVLDKFSFDR
jgi:hypothetical protein